VQVLGQRGVRHAASGVGGMLGLAPNGLDTLDAVRLDEAGRKPVGGFCRWSQHTRLPVIVPLWLELACVAVPELPWQGSADLVRLLPRRLMVGCR
jgi:hypothetical protein